MFSLLVGCDSAPMSGADGGDAGSGFDAGPAMSCDTPGATETVECGSCGTVERFCTAEGVWAYGTCSETGVCAPGTTRTMPCGNCGEQTEVCTNACAWELSGTCMAEGECTPGDRTRGTTGCGPGETRELECDAACTLVPAGACMADMCTSPGATETVACGNCGTVERFCTIGMVWSYGTCEGEGICAPGSVETRACGNCGTREARCGTTCQWDESAACTGEGVCAAGTTTTCTTTCGSTGSSTCSATCSAGACTPPMEACNGVDDDCDGAIDDACVDPCADAAAARSSFGCEHWPIAVMNTQLDRATFSFAIAVSNPNASPASVTVRRGTTEVATRTIAARSADTITLPWVDALQNASGSEVSAIVAGGAYRVTSTLPVAVHQFNPLQVQSGDVFSYTNDASLVLPAHALTGRYVVTSRPALVIERVQTLFGSTISGSPSTFTLAATSNATVTIVFSANVRASTDGTTVRAFRRGETGTFTLLAGDVLQIATEVPTTCTRSGGSDMTTDTTIYYCSVGPEYDLTGTTIRATAPVSVIAGHDCAFLPYNRWACDHLEDTLYPAETWGLEVPVGITRPLRAEPNIVRIVSDRDGNALTFEPASVHAPITLSNGGILDIETSTSFVVRSTFGIQVAQFLVGQDYAGFNAAGTEAEGDPSMALVVPREQYRRSYSFFVPSTYAQSYVDVIAPTGASVMLDGTAVSGFAGIGASGLSVAHVAVTPGVHHLESTQAFGATVYGFASYTSYMFPAGLDLARIRTLP